MKIARRRTAALLTFDGAPSDFALAVSVSADVSHRTVPLGPGISGHAVFFDTEGATSALGNSLVLRRFCGPERRFPTSSHCANGVDGGWTDGTRP